MQALGYESMGEFGIRGRRFFRKHDSTGTRTHHLHAFCHQSPDIDRHLAFRDYLIAHPETAQLYSELQRSLVETCNIDVEAYMEAKDSFIKMVEQKAIYWRSKLTERPTGGID